jgi:phosphate transport system substrate-binding protein
LELGTWLVGVVLLAGCAAPTATTNPAPDFTVAATDLTATLLADLIAAYKDVGAAPRAVVVAQSALPAELAARNADLGLTANPAPGQFATPLGYVTFAVVVHPNNPVNALSLAQVRAIVAGEIVSWAQVGGPSAPITVILREDGSDGARALAFESITRSALIAPTWAAARELLAQSQGALTLLPAHELSDSVKVIEVDAPLRALIVAVAPMEPAGPARNFLAWAQSEAGQAVVARRYEPLPAP